MVATRGRTFKRPWRRSCLSSKLKSSSAPIGRKDSWCFHAVGSSNAPLLGSTAAEGWPRIGRTSIATRWRSCGLPQSASCSENFVIPPVVFGQTLSSRGGDVLGAIELGEEVRKQWAWTAVDDDGECLGACVLVLAAGVRRTPAPEKVGLQRPNLEQKELASTSGDRTKQKSAALAKSVESYLARMGMPNKLYQEIKSSKRVLFLDARRLKALGLDGTDPAYEEWLREHNHQQAPQPN